MSHAIGLTGNMIASWLSPCGQRTRKMRFTSRLPCRHGPYPRILNEVVRIPLGRCLRNTLACQTRSRIWAAAQKRCFSCFRRRNHSRPDHGSQFSTRSSMQQSRRFHGGQGHALKYAAEMVVFDDRNLVQGAVQRLLDEEHLGSLKTLLNNDSLKRMVARPLFWIEPVSQ